ncbi:hypothetical protein R6Q59_032938 [Mikania micrantha]
MIPSNLDRLIVSCPHSDVNCRKLSDSRDHQQNLSSSNLASGALKIKVSSSSGEFMEVNDQLTTPRSVEHKITVTKTCPPAPRKAKRVPTTGKRSASCFPVVRTPADFMVYLDAMLALNETVYVPDVVVGDLGAGDHVKRLKSLPTSAHKG